MSGATLDDTVVYPAWSWKLDDLLGRVVGLTDVEVARLNGMAYQRKHGTVGPDAERFIHELWERCYGES